MKMREVCSSIVSVVVLKLLYVFFVFEFGIVGATLGAITGVVIGWNNKRRLNECIIIGAISGASLSYKLIKAISEYLYSDDDDYEVGFLIHLGKLITEDLVKLLRCDQRKIMGFNKAPWAKLLHW